MTTTHETSSRTRLALGTLGPLVATLGDGHVNLGARWQRAVVAARLLARSHPMSADRLLDALWVGAPVTAKSLPRGLADSGGTPERDQTSSEGEAS